MDEVAFEMAKMSSVFNGFWPVVDRGPRGHAGFDGAFAVAKIACFLFSFQKVKDL